MKAIAVAAVSLIASFAAAAEPPKVTGIYSNMRFGTEDVTGVEVFILFSQFRGNSQYLATVQCAEGVPGVPEVVPVMVSGTSVSFKITSEQSGCPTVSFAGQITELGLAGTFEGTADYPGFLKRGRSYWQ